MRPKSSIVKQLNEINRKRCYKTKVVMSSNSTKKKLKETDMSMMSGADILSHRPQIRNPPNLKVKLQSNRKKQTVNNFIIDNESNVDFKKNYVSRNGHKEAYIQSTGTYSFNP